MTRRTDRLLSILLGASIGLLACFTALKLLKKPNEDLSVVAFFAVVLLMVTPFVTSVYAAERLRKAKSILPLLEKLWPARYRAATAINALVRHRRIERAAVNMVLIVTTTIYAVGAHWLLWPFAWNVVGMAIGGCIVLNVAHLAFEYRVLRGLYATDRYEARELVEFILANPGGRLSGGVGTPAAGITAPSEDQIASVFAIDGATE